MAYKRISPQPIVEGGTGAQTFTSNGVLLGNTTSAITATTAGTTGQILTGVTGSAPTFQSPAASSISITGDTGGAQVGSAFTFTGGVTGLSFGGTSNIETLGGILVVANGGTGRATLTNHGVLVGAGTGAVTQLAVGTTGQVLTGVTGSDPVFASPAASSISITGDTGGALTGAAFTFTGGTTGLSFGGSGSTETVSGTLVVKNGGTGIATATAYSVICAGTTATGAFQSLAALGASGTVLTSNGAGALPSFTAIPASVTSIAGTANQITASASTGAVTLSTPSTFIAPGSIAATTTVTATLGNITATAGDFVATAGNLALPTTSATVGRVTSGGNNFLHAYGTGNTFLGILAGNTTLTTATSVQNTAMGQQSQTALTTSTNNASLGYWSLLSLTSGNGQNTAVGAFSLDNLATGVNNTAVGYTAGASLTTNDSNNILLSASGTAGDNGRIRIGTNATHTSCFIQGISGVTVTGTAVLCSTAGQLGTIASSRKYKDNIKDMDDSEIIHKLRPVTFVMKNDPTKHRQWGLIAEEVQDIYPNLVNNDEEGNPNSVRYLDLIPMLLREVQSLRTELNYLKGIK